MSTATRCLGVIVVAAIVAACSTPRAAVPEPAPTAPPGLGAALPALDLGAAGFAAWAAARAPTLGIPPRALQAYAYAAASTADDDPGCGVGWTTLAGTGSVESLHGTYRGSRLDPAGKVAPPIRGALLDGGPGIARVEDTDDGRLDGNTELDRAVGPMQFIPTTWARWGTDADSDGVDDPDDIDDAALAAAHYLCARGGDLRTAAGWERAILGYNRSGTYVREVLARASDYASGRAP